MIEYRCNVPRLVITDVSPPLVFQYGKISGVESRVFQKSQQMKMAVERNELTVIPKRVVHRPASSSGSVDVSRLVTELTRSIEGVVRAPDSSVTHNLLGEILSELRSLRADIRSVGSFAQGSVRNPIPVSGVDVYIPTSFKRDDVEAKLGTDDSTDVSVSSAEDALRKIKGSIS
tara:strand:+ start:7579 stop:8100 length:522 start_codon:yes stop_codon:yes gene_type:complete